MKYLLPNGNVTNSEILASREFNLQYPLLPDNFYEFLNKSTSRRRFVSIEDYIMYVSSLIGISVENFNWEYYTDNTGIRKIRVFLYGTYVSEISEEDVLENID